MSKDEQYLSQVLTFAKQFTAGFFAGTAQILVGHPLDTVKVRLQIQDDSHRVYKGTFDCIQKTFRREGILGFYKGMLSPLTGAAFVNAILFGAYSQTRGYLQKRQGNSEPLPISNIMFSGGIAGIANSIACGPVELVKTQLQIQSLKTTPEGVKYHGSFDCAKKIIQGHGVRGLFLGMGPTIMREIPAMASYYGLYEFFKRRLTPEDSEIPVHYLLLAGSTGGVGYWLSAYPIDSIKTRIQSQSFDSPRIYKGFFDCLKKVVKSEGVGALYRGLTPCLIRSLPASAVTFTVFEMSMKIMNR